MYNQPPGIAQSINSGAVGRHETFTPRYGWLKKGFDAFKKDPHVFNASDAIERLGVGKNMVRSIRFWCLAFKLIGQNRKGELSPTEFAEKLLGDNGWDPYLEDLASVWLLHWHLFVPPFRAVSWPLIFNFCNLLAFDLKQLGRSLITASKNYEKLSLLSENSFEKDASCMIRMYAHSSSESSFEIESPFCQIDILRNTAEPNSFRFNVNEKQTLPPLIFAAACFSFAHHNQPDLRSLSLHKIVYDFNSPGVAFKVSETEAGQLINEVTPIIDGVEFLESMGSQQLQFEKEPDALFWQVLDRYFKSTKKVSS